LSRWTRVIVNVSRAQEAEGLALGLFERGQSRVVVNGVDVARLAATAAQRADARGALGLPASAAVVGTAARFDPVKRLDLQMGAALGAEQRTRARSEFDVRQMLTSVEGIYGEVLGL